MYVYLRVLIQWTRLAILLQYPVYDYNKYILYIKHYWNISFSPLVFFARGETEMFRTILKTRTMFLPNHVPKMWSFVTSAGYFREECLKDSFHLEKAFLKSDTFCVNAWPLFLILTEEHDKLSRFEYKIKHFPNVYEMPERFVNVVWNNRLGIKRKVAKFPTFFYRL